MGYNLTIHMYISDINLDPAFVDRIDIKQYVGDPNPDAIFAILQSCINELGRKGLIGDGVYLKGHYNVL